MASADLDHIRALLIAQTAEPKPRVRRLFGRPSVELPAARRTPEPLDDHVQELLLKAICSPLPVEAVPPLPPPAPRDRFGRRADFAAEAELQLAPAQPIRRLRVLDDTGSAIGEVVLLVPSADDQEEVPYFPEDLMECEPFRRAQPMRPWITALRNSGSTRRRAVVQTEPEAPEDEALPLAHRIRNRRAAKHAAKITPPPPLSRDLLDALALALSREQEALADRLLAVAA